MTGFADVEAAAGVLAGIVRETPVLESDSFSSRAGGRVLVKAEHVQRTGSFKIRGAYVRLSRCKPGGRVVAASAGNHGQGVAWAATRLGLQATIVAPVFASLPKVESMRGYGAEVVLEGDTFEDALVRAHALAEQRGAPLIHAFDDPGVIAGQGTVGLEICRQAPGADRVIVAVGGGGLAAGIALAVKTLSPSTAVIGVRAAASPATIADGAAVSGLGKLTGPIVERLVDDIVSVDEEAISDAIVWHLERTKQVVEGAGALPTAALFAGLVPSKGTSVLVASGGNIDPGLLARVIRHGLSAAGRFLFLRLRLHDRPGELQHVLALLAQLMVNVVSVVHHRLGMILPVDEVEVELTLETRNREHARQTIEALRSAGYAVEG